MDRMGGGSHVRSAADIGRGQGLASWRTHSASETACTTLIEHSHPCTRSCTSSAYSVQHTRCRRSGSWEGVRVYAPVPQGRTNSACLVQVETAAACTVEGTNVCPSLVAVRAGAVRGRFPQHGSCASQMRTGSVQNRVAHGSARHVSQLCQSARHHCTSYLARARRVISCTARKYDSSASGVCDGSMPWPRFPMNGCVPKPSTMQLVA